MKSLCLCCFVILLMIPFTAIGQTPDAYELALQEVSQNADWTPYEEEVDGVPMMLVPVGCFMMGSKEQQDEKPVHEQCFSEPFWIDKYEVRQADFVRLGGGKARENYFSGENRPVESITWYEALDFCAKRGMRLPTEAEWEYAAGGVDSWIFPWGNEWDQNKVIAFRDILDGTAEVGSLPDGASWVGAMDMAGNLAEWISSVYQDYPYDAGDGREDDSGTAFRVVRGGSWLYSQSGGLRVASRYSYFPEGEGISFGFRCARS